MSFSYSGGVITQTGTDTDLSGLSGLTGVTVTSYSSRYAVYAIGTSRLDIQGNLTINPEENMLISNAATGTIPNMSLNVRNGATLTLGVKTTVGTANKYTTGTAFILAEPGNLNADGSLLVESGGALQAFGATIQMAGPARIRGGATFAVEDLTLVNCRSNSCQFRIEATSVADVALVSITENGMTLNGVTSSDSCRLTTTGNTNPFDPDSFIFNFVRAQYQPASAGYPPQVFLNFDNGNNVDSADFAYAGSGGTSGIQFNGTLVDFRNVARRLRYTNANNAGGFCKTTKNVNFALQDASGSGLSTISYYAVDVDNSSRINFNGFDSTADIVYSGQNAGPTLALNITAEFMAGQSTTQYVDSRTNADDTILFRFVSYATNISSSSPVLIGLRDLNSVIVNADDALIAESNRTTVDAYTELDTPQKVYDRAKSYLTANYAGEAQTIVTRSGNELDARALDVVIDATAAQAFDLTGSTLTIKASTYTGDMVTTGIITLANGATFIGTRTDANGTVLPLRNVSITGITAGSRLQIYNVTTAAEVVNTAVAGTSYTATYAEGTGYNSGDTVRIRLTQASTITAKLPFEVTALATDAGWAALVSQEDDAVYNALAVDGSTVTTFTADYTNDQVDVVVATNFNISDFYAWWVYNLTTSGGIREFFGGIAAEDQANFRINSGTLNLFLDNTTTTNIRQLDNRRFYRQDLAYPVLDPTTGGGGIDVVWRDKVFVAGLGDVESDLNIINQGVQKASILVPHTTNL